MKSGAARYRFGSFVLTPSEHTLFRGNEPVRLARMDFELLSMLVERSGHLIRKEELLQKLWPDVVVEEGNLAKHVSILRKALGDREEAGRMIETVPRVGFRFIAPVERIDSAAPAAVEEPQVVRPSVTASRALATVLILAALATTAAIVVFRSTTSPDRARTWEALAVLPFRSLESAPGESDPLGMGLADRIITRLSGQNVLVVRPTSAVRGYATGHRPSATELGRALDVGVLLDGHIQRAGDLVRVTVQLTDVAQGSIAWAEAFDQPTAELFKLEDAIAERVAGALRLQLAAAEQARLRRRYTENGRAYLAYLEGRESLLRYTPEGTARAVAAFERALELDSGYALARAGLATASAEMYLRFAAEGDLRQWGERAEREAAAAITLDPDIAEAHAALAAVFRKREFDWDQTLVESRRALTLDPNLEQPHLYAAAAFYHFGLMEQASAELERGRRVGGQDVVEALRIEALIALFSGNYLVARQRLEEVSRRSNRAIGDVYLAMSYYYSGDVSSARRLLETLATETSASTAARAGAALAGILAAAGDADRARRTIGRVLAREYRDHHVSYSLGGAYAQLGDRARAIESLRAAADTGFPCAIWYGTDPLLQPLRADPQFAALQNDLAARRDAAAAKHGQPSALRHD